MQQKLSNAAESKTRKYNRVISGVLIGRENKNRKTTFTLVCIGTNSCAKKRDKNITQRKKLMSKITITLF